MHAHDQLSGRSGRPAAELRGESNVPALDLLVRSVAWDDILLEDLCPLALLDAGHLEDLRL